MSTRGRLGGVAVASLAPWLAGCLYIEPGWEPTANQLPVVVSPDPDDGLEDIPLLMDRDIRLTVVARDPEGEPLAFVWVAPVEVDWSTSTQGDLWYSALDLEADPKLDGQNIEVFIDDGDLVASVSWLVEVP